MPFTMEAIGQIHFLNSDGWVMHDFHVKSTTGTEMNWKKGCDACDRWWTFAQAFGIRVRLAIMTPRCKI